MPRPPIDPCVCPQSLRCGLRVTLFPAPGSVSRQQALRDLLDIDEPFVPRGLEPHRIDSNSRS